MKSILLCLLLAAGDYSNRRAPGFSLPDSHYQQHDPQDYRGKVLLIDIMTTTCGTCMRLADTLAALQLRFGTRIAIISVLTMPDTFDTANRFASEHNVTWPMVFDSGQMIASYLRLTPGNPQVHFPHLFLIDRDGYIRNDFGADDEKALSADALSGEIEKLVK